MTVKQAAPPRQIDVRFPALHAAQRDIVGYGFGRIAEMKGAPRFRVVVCGRRFGKSVLALWALGRVALIERKPYAYFAPTYKMLSEMWREFKRILTPAIKRKDENEKRLELVGGGVIDFWSLDNPDAARGRKYAGIVIDEAALFRNGGEAWQAALRPLLADYRGWAMFISTPRGKGWLHDLFVRGLDPSQREWRSYHYPTFANPFIAPTEIDSARSLLPTRLFAQEYLAEWQDDAGGVFRGVSEVATLAPAPPPRRGCVVGVDLARLEDFTVISVIDPATREQVFMERFNRIAWALQVDRIRDAVTRYGADLLVYDATGVGDAVGEMLDKARLPCRVEGVKFTVDKKGEVIEMLALAIEHQDVRLLADPLQVGELKAYEMEKLASGRYRYSAPSGLHDDTVMALALAWYGAQRRSFTVPIALDWRGRS